MAEYNPSKIIKDGNTYNFRDDTKIPLAGSNAISGDLIPATDNSIDIGSSTKNIKMLYTKGITINGTQFLPSDYATLSGLATVATSGSYNDLSNTPTIPSKTSDLTNDSGFITSDNTKIPLAGSNQISGSLLASSTVDEMGFGHGWGRGGTIYTYSPTHGLVDWQGAVRIQPLKTTTDFNTMELAPNGTLTWDGQPIQYVSDQRLKQQITEIDDKLLDAWEDVDLVQYKYNDAVDQKGNNARLHTGYVVQQIDKACKSHGVDVSAYGLYCHEEYPEETKEVEVEQKDGTKIKERKVIREASEHYSLRYTEALIVECAYLRKCIKELRNEIEQLKSSK